MSAGNSRNGLIILALPVLLGACSILPNWLGEKEAPPVEGERSNVLSLQRAITSDEGMDSVDVVIPEARTEGNWTQVPGALEQMGNPALPAEPRVTERAGAGEGNDWPTRLVSAPIVVGDLVLGMDARGHVSAHSVDGLSEQWSASVVDGKAPEALPGGGLASDGMVVIAVNGSGLAAAFDVKTGEVKWRKALNVPVRAEPRLADNRVLLTTLDNQSYALNVADGAIIWKHSGLNEVAGIMGAATPAVASGMAIVAYSSAEIFALKVADGRDGWAESLATINRTSRLSELSDIDASPVVAFDTVFIGSHGGSLAAFDVNSGRPVWEREVAMLNTPWLAEDFLYLLTEDYRLVAIYRRDGRIKWVQDVPKFVKPEKETDPIRWSGPVMGGGKLYLAGNRGTLLQIDPANGSIAREIDIPDDVYTAPVIAQGRMFLMTDDAELVALQ